MTRTRIIIVVALGAILGTFWWFYKFPKAYGAYTLHGVYVKPAPSLAPDSIDALPVYYPFANIVFGANPNVLASQGDETYRIAHPDDPTQSIIFTTDTGSTALVDEYIQYFKDSGYNPSRTSNVLGTVINARKEYQMTVLIRDIGPSGSYVRIIKTP